MIAQRQSERQVQREILRMCGLVFPDVLVAHVPNGAHLSGDDRSRSMQMGALKGDGLKLGFPDLIVLWDGGCGFLEVKRPGGKLSDNQVSMHAKIAAIGHTVATVDSAVAAQESLLKWGAPATGARWRAAA